MFFIPLLFPGILFSTTSDVLCGTVPVTSPVETILPLLIYFNSDDCATCDEFDALFEKAEIIQRLEKKYVPVKVSIDDLEGRVCADIYDVTYIPAFVIADQKGVILYKSDETLTLDEITPLLENIPDQFTGVRPAVEIVTSTDGSLPELKSEIRDNVPASVIPDNFSDNSNEQSANVARVTPSPEIPKVVPVNNMDDLTQMQSENQKAVHHDKPLMSTDDSNVPKATAETHPINKSTTSKSISAKSRATTVSRTYAIQLGYFTEETNASKLVQKAKEKGLTEMRTQTETRNGVSYFRVLIGRCPTLSEAQRLLDQVHRVGLKGAVYRQ